MIPRLGESDAVLLGDHGDASLPPSICPIEFLYSPLPFFKFGRLVQLVPNFANIAKP